MKRGLFRYSSLFILISVLPVLIMAAVSTPAAGPQADLVMLPAAQDVNVGDTLTVSVEARCGSLTADRTDIYVDFDPMYLSVLGAWIEGNLKINFDNTLGIFGFESGLLKSPYPTGTFTVVNIVFQARSATAAPTALTFHTSDPRKTIVGWEGKDITGLLTGGTVSIKGQGAGGGGGGGSSGSAPAVTSVSPVDKAAAVSVNTLVSAVFSQTMNSSTLTQSSFTLMTGSTPVAGTVAYDSTTYTATFSPSDHLAYSSTYTATITTAVSDSSGYHLGTNRSWSFTTAAAPSPVVTSPASSPLPSPLASPTTNAPTPSSIMSPIANPPTPSLAPPTTAPAVSSAPVPQLTPSVPAAPSPAVPPPLNSSPPAAPAPPRTSTPPPTSASWGLIGGIIAAVVIIVLVVFILVRRKRA